MEWSLHTAVKNWYTRPGDELEVLVDGYMVDIVRGDLLIEIQTRNFSSIKRKLTKLIRGHRVTLVHPIAKRKWIVRVDADGDTVLFRRMSPRRGGVEDLFIELVYIPRLVKDPNFSVDVLLVHSEDVLIDDGKGSWRRRRWSIHDRRLLDVIDTVTFKSPEDFTKILPSTLPEKFTTKDLARESGTRPTVAQRMAYCLRKMNVIEAVGKSGKSLLYAKLIKT